MTYQILLCHDTPETLWMFGFNDPKRGHQLFAEYRHLMCANCGRIPEQAALDWWISPSIKVKTKRDIVTTADGQLLIRRLAAEDAAVAGIQGLKTWTLPGDNEFFVLSARIFVHTDALLSGVRFCDGDSRRRYDRSEVSNWTADHRCTLCGRIGETVGLPTSRSLSPPPDERTVFTPSMAVEKFARNTLIYMPRWAVDQVKKLKLRGAALVPAPQ